MGKGRCRLGGRRKNRPFWVGNVVQGGKLVRTRTRWDNIKMDLEYVGCDDGKRVEQHIKIFSGALL
jgi:hypothetical protein